MSSSSIGDVEMVDHITQERLLEVSRGSGYEFSEEEVQHLTHCEECGRLLTVFLKSALEAEAKPQP
jgi:hypothetical protein